MDWFKRKDKKIKEKNKKAIPDGLWEKCPSCKEILFKPELDKNLSVCRHCDFHFRMNFRPTPRNMKIRLVTRGNIRDSCFLH